jgi:hypothetical protein
MSDIYIVEGGVGRHVFFTALIPTLAKKEKIMVMSSYTDIFETNPYVERSLGRGTPYAWGDIVKKDNNNVRYADPYFNADFIKGKIHVIESWARELGIEYSKSMTPELYLPQNFIDDAKRFKKEHGDFIIVQFSSGQSPLSVDPNQPFQWIGFQRNYALDKAQELIGKIQNKYKNLKIVLFGLPNEFTNQLEGVIKLTAPYLVYAALLQESKGFIGVNSCLMHFAGALETPGIVLWGGSDPKQWGYDCHVNLNHECSRGELFCTRPFLRDLGDFVGNGQKWLCPNPTCMNIPTDSILKELDVILEKSKQ